MATPWDLGPANVMVGLRSDPALQRLVPHPMWFPLVGVPCLDVTFFLTTGQETQ